MSEIRFNTGTDTGGLPPHAGGPVLTAGTPAGQARIGVILLHGRGGNAQGILQLADALAVDDACYVAPQAAGHQWYPKPFRSPRSVNAPAIASSFSIISSLIRAFEQAGIPARRLAIGGFSQGACLATDYAAWHPRRYGAIFAFTGGLIGEAGIRLAYEGSLESTPVFLGANDPDDHVPFARVQETAEVLSGMGAEVELVRYPGAPHTVVADEIDRVRLHLNAIER